MTARETNVIEPAEAEQSSPNQATPVIGVSSGDDGNARNRIPDVLSILPLRGTVIFPGTVVPLTVRRDASLKLLDETLTQTKIIGLFTQKSVDAENPGIEDLYRMGVAAQVLKLLRQPNDTTLIVVQALERVAIKRPVITHPYLRAEVDVLHSVTEPGDDKEWTAAVKNLRESALRLLELTPDAPEQAREIINQINDPGRLADFLASNLNIEAAEKQDLLEELQVVKRVRAVQGRISNQVEIAELQKKLQQDVANQFTDMQRKAYLREQIKAIQRELGEDDQSAGAQIDDLRKKLQEAKPPAEIMEHAERELRRLTSIPPASPEFSVIVSYLETLSELPWSKLSEEKIDLNEAQRILDRDHYDLEKVKRRLIEYLAVRKLNPKGSGAILCLLGPPGVGKTSLGQSIADALGRKFVRLSLGGIRDEAEIRGHRRTYIGSMPGRIIQELRRVGTRNPVMMLDEVDKLGADFRGDPASALLEVLDPRQNNAFVDRYLDVPFDLSQIIFIATANYIEGIPAPLLDRMELIDIAGYTERQKLEIGKRYLVPRQLQEHGLNPEQCIWEDESLTRVIEDYTREAGVREFERQVAAICRAVAARVARGEAKEIRITPQLVREVLGPPKYIRESRLKTNKPGVVTGLAYTPFGGEVLHIEATQYAGKGNVTLTGQIGNVMKESVQAALSLVRSRVQELGINPEVFKDADIHVHVPAGAVPKDGPSAGVAMFTALASLFTNKPVRADVAMTGEITLRGLVLPIGGLKEKTLAAMRAGITTVIVPKLNEKDIPDVTDEARQNLKFVFAETVDDVLREAIEAGKS